ncbi:macoilin-2 [Aricia agestis]|uniref:macoilin-2 n=1 Tax=Aricia agestis TaxID=91739 RepID=UPI001C20BD01|nr:macoilin-2 [Aricia agestis]
MKRRNAESGKMRRPMKRTKITEGMYGNSMCYLKFVMLWATVIMADNMLEFRFEFLWPFWMMLRSVYDSFKYHGVAFSVFFICIAMTSDMLFFFFIPIQYIFFAASTYVWVQYVWYTFADRGVCLPTVALCCLVVYAEGAVRGRVGALELWRPLAAHCVGYPALSLGFGVKAYVGQRLRQRRQRQVRAENEFYFQLMRDALPESALEQNKEERASGVSDTGRSAGADESPDARHNSLRRRRDHSDADDHIHVKLDKLEKHLAQQTAARERDKSAQGAATPKANGQPSSNGVNSQSATPHAHTNGAASGPGAPPDDKHDNKGAGKSSKHDKKEASSVREEKKKNKNRDKDKENTDSNKCTEQNKEFLIKEVESTKENIKSNKDINNFKEKERERKEEKERELREKEAREKREEKEREAREREQKEKEQRAKENRCFTEELRRVRAELAAARSGEAEARRALAAAAAADRRRAADLAHLRHAHAQLQNKVTSIRTGERAALERRLSEERRARTAAEQLLRARPLDGECDNEWCKSRRSAQEGEVTSLRRELQRARERQAALQRDLAAATEQVRGGCGESGSCAALRERATHLERSLSAETRVKLDLLSALGDAKRHIMIQEDLISRQEKEIEELKAQMLAVMPSEYMTPVNSTVSKVSKLRLSDGSPLDPNASVYTPKMQQLCSDA